ncbi:hypothetical protein B566_EDAN012965 [Ephemera danica]|nr:hypothetical protein B566_EDAN012965 [Ephemera danica]
MPRFQEELNACDIPDINKLMDEISTVLDTRKVDEWLDEYDKKFNKLIADTKRHNSRFEQQVLSPSGLDIEDVTKVTETYINLREKYRDIPPTVDIGIFQIELAMTGDKLHPILNYVESFLRDIVNIICRTQREVSYKLCEEYKKMYEFAREDPASVEDAVELLLQITAVQEKELPLLSTRVDYVETLLEYLTKYAFFSDIITENDFCLGNKVIKFRSLAQQEMEHNLDRLLQKKADEEKILQDKIDEFAERLTEHLNKCEEFMKEEPPEVSPETVAEQAELSSMLWKKLHDLQAELKSLNKDEVLLELDQTPFPKLKILMDTFEFHYSLWKFTKDFYQRRDYWFNGPLSEIVSGKVQDEVAAFKSELFKVRNGLTQAPAHQSIAKAALNNISNLKDPLRLLEVVCNPAMRTRHWDKMAAEIGTSTVLQDLCSLQECIDEDLMSHMKVMEDVSIVATNEFDDKQKLDLMVEEWKDIRFEFNLYKDTGVKILSAVDKIQETLDEHSAKSQRLLNSIFVEPFMDEMQEWASKLVKIQKIFELWIPVQQGWMYLQPIFGSPDIQQQMPQEGQQFSRVNRIFLKIMQYSVAHDLVLEATEKPNLLDDLRECNTLLTNIKHRVNTYLEKKRSAFPRFYFLSNDELLEILAETKEPLRVQPHLKKFFEGINKLEFDENKEIVGMESAEQEKVSFLNVIKPVEAKGLVEKWLLEVETEMFNAVKNEVLKAIDDYDNTPRREWVQKWIGQAVIFGATVAWTREVEQAILADAATGGNEKLKASKDVVKLLIDEGVKSITDFVWLSQLRYYRVPNNITVRMVQTEVPYGCEYLGNTPRLVITPLTDRCYRTLMCAMDLYLGGAPEGPAGTGKTETSKDLAKALAKHCVVFNCSDQLDHVAMGKFFKGISQCGSWACFDEFNRIELEVLSVVAAQINMIQEAKLKGQTRFDFEGSNIKLNASCQAIITMNPGYAGRQELPDNLKRLFRPVAMMVPDYALIGELSLYSRGFKNARPLSVKIVQTYKLCSEQLSSQPHYDYGMRAVKSVLTAAGNLKLNDTSGSQSLEDESKLVLRAIIDVNRPKFLAEDVPLFEGIVADLFPGVDLPPPDRGELLEALYVELKLRNLQATDWYLEKLIQLYEMILVRHGLMLVGPPFGGKSSAFKVGFYLVLADALIRISENPDKKMDEHGVIFKVISTKSITSDQLYGYVDTVSQEWHDGVLANTFREYARSETPIRKWIILDGPVDAVWVENLNTVLDDNKKLCLSSGEVVQMSNTMNLIFETGDLDQASPATVSRCGMVFMDPGQLGVGALMKSYCEGTLHKHFNGNEEQLELMHNIMKWLLPPALAAVKPMPKFVETSEMHQFDTFARLLNGMMEMKQDFTMQWVQGAVVFAAIWGVGSTLTAEGRKAFDSMFRIVLKDNSRKPEGFELGETQLIPSKGTLHEWAYTDDGTWVQWEDTIQIDDDAQSNKMLVSTPETACMQFFLRTCLGSRLPVLFVGPTGTGKSVVTVDHLLSLPSDDYLSNIVNFSARTSANLALDLIMDKLIKLPRHTFGPEPGKKCIVFVDDLNMPQKEEYGAQPPIELLRQWLDHGYWFDADTNKMHLKDVLLVAAMAVPGNNDVTDRLLRQFIIIGVDKYADPTVEKIFGTMIEGHFSQEVATMGSSIVTASMQAFAEASTLFRPLPSTSHYLFNLRDISRLIQGVMLVPPSKLTDKDKLIRLWAHEAYRVFYDRLVDQSEREKFFEVVKEAVSKCFAKPLKGVLASLMSSDEEMCDCHMQKLYFGNFMIPDAFPREYDEIPNEAALKMRLESYLREYNETSRTPMSFVMSPYAVGHICRVSRVLQQANGHVLLMGMGGSGRRSVARFATNLAGYDLYEIEMTKSFGVPEWKDHLRILLRRAGAESRQIVFLFSDTQVADESFLEDINLLLNTGDIPNLYGQDDKMAILDEVRKIIEKQGKKFPNSVLAQYSIFIELVKQNLHVVLAMSPIGKEFRERLRMFPSLINCCTLDWLTNWPEDMLRDVADDTLKDIDLSGGSEDEGASAKLQDVQKELEVQLKTKAADVAVMIENLEEEKAKVNDIKERVQAEEAEATISAQEVAKLEAKCSAELEKAEPALIEAEQALDTIKPADITVVKSMKNPPKAVKTVMEAICIMLGAKPESKMDSGTGKRVNDFWTPSQKLLGDMKFIENLKTYDKNNISDDTMAKIRNKYMKDPDFVPEVVKKSSAACEGLCLWVYALEKYNTIYKVVGPLQRQFEEVQAEANAKRELLEQKQAQVRELEAKLQVLEDNYQEQAAMQAKLEAEKDLCAIKLKRAEELIAGVGGEKVRWKELELFHRGRLGTVVGDMLLSVGIIAYLGPFSVDYRQGIQKTWVKRCQELGIPCSGHFSMLDSLGDPVQLQDWVIAGLPVDEFSQDNAIIAHNAGRWPLFIDPQGQAKQWIKNAEGENGLLVLKMSNPKYTDALQRAINNGWPALIEDVGEELDPALNPLFLKQTYMLGGMLNIRVGNDVVRYNENFRLYLTTRLSNPHYLPETAILVTLLNFAITPRGLEDQLLGLVVATERPDLEESRQQLKLSEDIKAKQEIAKETEKKLEDARQEYLTVAKHASELFFCISAMASLEPMYQYSLNWFMNLYVQSIKNSVKPDDPSKWLDTIKGNFTYNLYRNETIEEEALKFLLTTGSSLEKSVNPDPSWLSDKSWSEICRASKRVPSLKGLNTMVGENLKAWEDLYNCPDPHNMTYPAPMDELRGLAWLVIIKCLRPNKLVPAVQRLIAMELGNKYVEPPAFNLKDAFEDSTCSSPLIFVLSPGSDPTSQLYQFAFECDVKKMVHFSMGKGQGEKAEEAIKQAIKSRTWVVLHNVHLATSWMSQLELLCNELLKPEIADKDFRLWLTSYPSPVFPVSILQNGIKMTNEAPKGVRANMQRLYLCEPLCKEDYLPNRTEAHRKLLFGLCLFHAVVQERRSFGPLGWNIPYEFNDSDFDIALKQMDKFFKDAKTIPFDALQYLISECFYGGRVTDANDRRLIQFLLKNFLSREVVKTEGYKFSASGVYHMPEETLQEGCISCIQTMPLTARPELFGLHDNAEITKEMKETQEFLDGALETQPSVGGMGAGGASLQVLNEIAEEILEKLPPGFNLKLVGEKYPFAYDNSMNTVLRQELIRFNRLTNVIRMTLEQLKKAIKGEVIMTADLEEVQTSLLIGKVPQTWLSKSYPSLKPLGGYIADLLKRLEFLDTWIRDGAPNVYWISGFFFTQSFLTGVMQNYARRFQVPIDAVGFEYEVMDTEGDVDAPPDIGAYCNNDFIAKPSYGCPVYKTSARRGILSTTGHSTNFVMEVRLPSKHAEAHWVNRGVAALCQLDD